MQFYTRVKDLKTECCPPRTVKDLPATSPRRNPSRLDSRQARQVGLPSEVENGKSAKLAMGLKTQKFTLGIVIGLLVVFLIGAVTFLFWLSSSPAGRTNFLLLGITNSGRAGGDLTDTMIFISFDPRGGKVLTVSLPRDLWIAPIRAKLNAAYHYGGLDLAKSTVTEILGQSVNYAILVDSNLFVEAVDVLGGVEVEVVRSFDDYRYPIPGKENDECGGDPEYKCRYEHLHFEAGKQQVDGERALKYVRSRYAEGEEGTDFARNQRQQNLLLAIGNKTLSPRFFLQPQKTVQLFKVVSSNIKTDLPQKKYSDLLRMVIRLGFKFKGLETHVLDENLLVNPPTNETGYDNQWVLIPKAGDWSEIQKYVVRLLNE